MIDFSTSYMRLIPLKCSLHLPLLPSRTGVVVDIGAEVPLGAASKHRVQGTHQHAWRELPLGSSPHGDPDRANRYDSFRLKVVLSALFR